MMRIDVHVSDRDSTVHSVVSGEHLLEGMAEAISDQVTREIRAFVESCKPRLDGREVLLLATDIELLCKRYVLKDPETGTIIELEGGNRCDIKLESDGKSEEHDGD